MPNLAWIPSRVASSRPQFEPATLHMKLFPSGLMDESTKLSLLGVWMALFVVFAGRKFTQPIKDDIGDKSVFIFNTLSEEEKAALIKKLEQQNCPQNLN
ncbi:hypothetical protein PHJA_001072400 [Phtheirospermum japonicum]|uniref:Uncharacterized protein n=1 Tax=Phtheirospermum japonicum TaxID=374723 RepID=A0A830BNU1_9LAMI|nr:hypothetical protein PHJA_001072400 [Phtheirospermum japonicum]